jgi:hypothetical protein
MFGANQAVETRWEDWRGAKVTWHKQKLSVINFNIKPINFVYDLPYNVQIPAAAL